MNLLFLRIRIKPILSFGLILLAVNSTVQANDTIQNQTFVEYCKNADAYLIYKYTDVTFNKLWGNYERLVSIQNKMVINNKAGVDEYAFLNLNKYELDHLREIKVNTLKSDGSVVTLDSSIILNYKKKEEKLDFINYPIPGVEPGDTIDISYVYTDVLSLYKPEGFVSLYNSVPSYKTEYTIKAPPKLLIRYKSYNGFPPPQVVVNDEMVYCVFQMDSVKGLDQNEYTCLLCELPYFYYTANKEEDDLVEWKDVYNIEFNFLTQPLLLDYEKKSHYRRWKNEVIGEVSDSSKYYQFELLYNNILENSSVEPAREDEFIKSSGYFLKEKRFDPISLRRLYRQLLEDLEINYWAVFARSKRAGEIDPNFIRKGEYDHIFFAYENSSGTLNLLYPHDLNFKYQINEIPTTLYNTLAVIVQPHFKGKVKSKDKYINFDLELAEVDSVDVQLINLPGMNPQLNYLKHYFSCNVDTKEKSNSFSSKIMISGGLSTDIRSFLGALEQDKEMSNFYSALAEYENDQTDLDPDTVTGIDFKNKRPFTFSIKGEGSISNSISFVNDSLVIITLDELIQHSKINSESDTIDLNYYLDYSYSDLCMLMFTFSSNIEVLNLDDYNKVFKNDIGEYNFQVSTPLKNYLVIQSDYRIIKDVIEKSEYDQLKELNQLVKEIKNKRLLLKVLSTPPNN